MVSYNTAELRRQNRNRVFRYIYSSETPVSKQDIAHNLSLSLPTVGQNLRELLDAGLLELQGVDELCRHERILRTRSAEQRLCRCEESVRVESAGRCIDVCLAAGKSDLSAADCEKDHKAGKEQRGSRQNPQCMIAQDFQNDPPVC